MTCKLDTCTLPSDLGHGKPQRPTSPGLATFYTTAPAAQRYADQPIETQPLKAVKIVEKSNIKLYLDL